MQPHAVTLFFSIRSKLIYLVSALCLTACGLGMDTQARLERGQQAYEDGEYRAAIIDAKNVLQEEPDNVAARLLLGRASVEQGDGVSGEKELRRAAELGTDFGVVLADLGRALLQQGKYDDVVAEIDPELARNEPDRLSAMRSRGEALVGLGQPVAAREIFAEVLAADADDVEAQLGIVSSYIEERNYLQARETLNQVLTLDDSYIPSWLASGALGMRMRDSKRAQSDYGKAVELARQAGHVGGEMQALTGLTDALLALSKHDEAREGLVRMRQIAPDDTRTLLVRARLASIDEDWQTAKELLLEILRRAPDYRQAPCARSRTGADAARLRAQRERQSRPGGDVPVRGRRRRARQIECPSPPRGNSPGTEQGRGSQAGARPQADIAGCRYRDAIDGRRRQPGHG